MRQCTALEWFVLATINQFSTNSKYCTKTFVEIGRLVLGINDSGPVFQPVCKTLENNKSLVVDGLNTVDFAQLRDFKLTEKGEQILANRKAPLIQS